MKDYHINIFYSDADKGYIADIPDLDACSAFGKTPTEALKQAQLAKKVWLEAARAAGKPIPNRVTDQSYTKPARRYSGFHCRRDVGHVCRRAKEMTRLVESLDYEYTTYGAVR